MVGIQFISLGMTVTFFLSDPLVLLFLQGEDGRFGTTWDSGGEGTGFGNPAAPRRRVG